MTSPLRRLERSPGTLITLLSYHQVYVKTRQAAFMSVPTNRQWSVALAIFLLILFLAACVPAPTVLSDLLLRLTGDLMDWKSHLLSGINSVNCGRVKIGEPVSVATRCTLQASAERKPFRVIYNLQGIDSSVAGGIVRTRDGRVLSLSYDGLSLPFQQIDVKPCPQPYHLYVNSEGRINCFRQELPYPESLASPNIDPY